MIKRAAIAALFNSVYIDVFSTAVFSLYTSEKFYLNIFIKKLNMCKRKVKNTCFIFAQI